MPGARHDDGRRRDAEDLLAAVLVAERELDLRAMADAAATARQLAEWRDGEAACLASDAEGWTADAVAAGAALLLAGRLSGAQAAAAGDGARASMGHGPWRGGELGGGSGQSYPRETDGDSFAVGPVMYASAAES